MKRRRRPLVVKKFGGTSVAGLDRIRDVARLCCESRSAGEDVVVVVSAMAGETDRLLALGEQAQALPDEREMDALLASGEQVSCALLAMAIAALGEQACSLLGHQVPIETDSAHGKARVLRAGKARIKRALALGQIPVIAGFQGVSPSGDITTLGRGGSDTTAVALAAALGAPCEIYTDVAGVHTADPRSCDGSRKLDVVSCEEMLEMASLGAKVLQVRSVEIAMKYDVPIHVRSASGAEQGTWVTSRDREIEARALTALACERGQVWLELRGAPARMAVLSDLLSLLSELNVCADMLCHGAGHGRADVTFTLRETDHRRCQGALERFAAGLGGFDLRATERLAKVSLIGIGLRSDPHIAARLCGALLHHDIVARSVTASELRMSCLVDEAEADRAIVVLHEAFGLSRRSGEGPRP